MTAIYRAEARVELDSCPDIDRGIVLVKFGRDETVSCDVEHVGRRIGLYTGMIDTMLGYPKARMSVDDGYLGLSSKGNGKFRLTLHIDSFQEEHVELDGGGMRELRDRMAEDWSWAVPDQSTKAELEACE